MSKKLIFSMIIAALVILGSTALAQSSALEQRIVQPIRINGQSAQGVLVVQDGVIQTYTCDSPVQYVTANESESGWACFEQASGMWLLHAQPPAQQSSTVIYSSPSTVYVPTYSSYYPYYSYSYPYYPYRYYGYPYYWGSPFGLGFSFNFGHGFNGHNIRVNNGFVRGGFNRGSVGVVRAAPAFGHGGGGFGHAGGGVVRGGGGGFVHAGGGFRGGGGFGGHMGGGRR